MARALDKWVATMPYAVRGKADPSGWFVSRLVVREPPPPELSLIFADMISNLRATLDHIIWALVEESGNTTHDYLTFPVCGTGKTGRLRWAAGSGMSRHSGYRRSSRPSRSPPLSRVGTRCMFCIDWTSPPSTNC